MTKETTSAKAALAKGAESIRKAEAEAKSKSSKPAKKSKSVSSKTPPAKDGGELEVIPKIEECKDDIKDILARCATFNKEFTSVKLSKDTTVGEYVRIFDWAVSSNEHFGFILGDVVNEAPRIFGESKYAQALASTGRSIHTLKAYSRVARAIPTSLRDQHGEIKFTHLKAIAKVPELEDKKKLVAEMVERAEAGKPMTVPEVAKKADKLAPRPRRNKKPARTPDAPAYILSDDEQRRFSELAITVENAAALCKDPAMKFVGKLTAAETKDLRKDLAIIANFASGLSEL